MKLRSPEVAQVSAHNGLSSPKTSPRSPITWGHISNFPKHIHFSILKAVGTKRQEVELMS